MAYLESPDGTRITGTLEVISGVARLSTASRNPDGTLSVNYDGETEIFWDEQTTVERDGQRVFIDEDGSEFTEDQLTLVDGEVEC